MSVISVRPKRITDPSEIEAMRESRDNDKRLRFKEMSQKKIDDDIERGMLIEKKKLEEKIEEALEEESKKKMFAARRNMNLSKKAMSNPNSFFNHSFNFGRKGKITIDPNGVDEIEEVNDYDSELKDLLSIPPPMLKKGAVTNLFSLVPNIDGVKRNITNNLYEHKSDCYNTYKDRGHHKIYDGLVKNCLAMEEQIRDSHPELFEGTVDYEVRKKNDKIIWGYKFILLNNQNYQMNNDFCKEYFKQKANKNVNPNMYSTSMLGNDVYLKYADKFGADWKIKLNCKDQ